MQSSLRIKRICSETSEDFFENLKNFKDAFIKRDYHSKILDQHLERAMNLDPKILLENKEKPSTQGNLPLVLTCNKIVPKIKSAIDKRWHILSINENLLIKDHSFLLGEISVCPN